MLQPINHHQHVRWEADGAGGCEKGEYVGGSLRASGSVRAVCCKEEEVSAMPNKHKTICVRAAVPEEALLRVVVYHTVSPANKIVPGKISTVRAPENRERITEV